MNKTTIIKSLKNKLMKSSEQHPFHLVDSSPWPFFTSLYLLFVVSTIFCILHPKYYVICPVIYILQVNIAIPALLITILAWFTDIVIESTFEGNHTRKVQVGLKLGMVIFIISEVMLFFAFFWAFFHSSIIPSIWIGAVWPPIFLKPILIKPYILPILNTLILLASGISVTFAHRAIIGPREKHTRCFVLLGLIITIGYGLIFTIIQRYEYVHASFDITDSIYATTFYTLTGLHGLHVVIGTMLLMVSVIRHLQYHFTCDHHFGFEAAIWYWHFVDVVWLFLFFVLYCWNV
jgi:cytochrome c oxidase subunit 3